MEGEEVSLYESQEDVNSEVFEHSEVGNSLESTVNSDDDEHLYSHSSQESEGQTTSTSLNEDNLSKMTKQEQVEFLKLTSRINQLRSNMNEKEYQLKQTREELFQCREHIQILQKECQENETTLETLNEQGYKPSLSLVNHRLDKIRLELSTEKNVEYDLEEKIAKLELAVSEAHLTYSRYDSLQPSLQEKQCFLQQQKTRQAMMRVQSQTRQLIEAQRMETMKEKDLQHLLKIKEDLANISLEKTKQAQEDSQKFLQKSFARRKAKDEIEKEKHQRYMEQRMKALLSLKKNIESSQSALQAHQLLENEKQRRIKIQEKEEREKIILEGGNPDEVLLRRKRLRQLEKEKQNFEQRQKQKQFDIVSRIVEETKRQEKLNKKASQSHWQGRMDANNTSGKPKEMTTRKKKKKHREDRNLLLEEDNDTYQSSPLPPIEPVVDQPMTTSVDTIEKTLLQPEIPGLWEKRDIDNENNKKETHKQTKMEKAIMEKTLSKLKKSVIVTQVAAGKEFKGQGFLSKPEEIIFKDFDVGKVYRKRVQLTNVSYTVNHIKLIEVSENLKDFIQIEFNPPGAMSAGLTCPMMVTFEPKINKDIVGSIDLLSQTGPFSISVVCTTKKCLVSIETPQISFGSVCIGETVKKSITVHNKGGLPTQFTLVPILTHPFSHQTTSPTNPDSSMAQSKTPLSNDSQRSILSTVEYATDEKLISLGALEKNSHSVNDLNSLTTSKVQFDKEHKGTGKERKKSGKGSKISTPEPGNGLGDTKELSPPLHTKDTFQTINRQQGDIQVSTLTELQDDNLVSSTRPQDDTLVTGHDDSLVSVGIVPNEDTEVTVTHTISMESVEKPAKCLPIAITVGEIDKDDLQPYTSCTIELQFTPELPGEYKSQFKLITSAEPIIITATGNGIDVPIYTEKESLDLKICLVDRLYQDSIVLFNRSTVALQAIFSVPPSLQNYMEILPRHGLVQAESSFAAQLKFLPQAGIFDDGEMFFKEDKPGFLQVPISIHVTGQTTPVLFTVTTVVTDSDIELSQSVLEFGYCTIYESLIASIELTNKSCLPQDFGFVHLPKWISVQPNDGFGTLLPHETMSLDVIFTPDQPYQYSCDIICKTGINKDFKLSCNGIGVLPPLQLSHSAITFAATPLNATTVAHITVNNPPLSRTDSAVIRGMAPTQGPRMFEFCVPQGLPVSVSPAVGIVKPGELVRVDVSFHPYINPQTVQEKGVKLAVSLAEKLTKEEENITKEEEKPIQKSQKGRQGGSRLSNKSNLASRSKGSMASSSASQTHSQTQGQNEIEDESKISLPNPPNEGSDLWCEAYNSVITDYQNVLYQCSIPCFISTTLTNDMRNGQINYKAEETIYLDITATAVRPSLLVTSNGGRTTINFGNVGVGDKITKQISLKNISSNTLKLSTSCLDPQEGFEMRNALRDIVPGSSHSILLQFAPEHSGKYHETLKIIYGMSSYLDLTLIGEGVDPVVEVTPRDGPIDWDHVMMGDIVIQTLQLVNKSELSVDFCLKMESIMLPQSKRKGPANFNGQPLFTCIPNTGKISPGSSVDINIQFSPDRPDCLFTDMLDIEINRKSIQNLCLKGHSWSTNMYVLGGESLGPSDISMTIVPTDQGDIGTHPPLPLLVIFKHSTNSLESQDKGTKSSDPSHPPMTQQLHIGCIKTPLVKKTTGEYIIEPLQLSGPDTKCFTIEPMKSSVEAGGSRLVNITFTPPKDFTTGVIQAHTNLLLKGDTTIQRQLFIQAVHCNS